MAFLKIDKERMLRKGAVFIAKVGDDKIVVGRVAGSNKTNALLKVAADYIAKGVLPRIEIMRFRKSTDTYRDEALLHSHLHECLDTVSGLWYRVNDNELKQIWKDVQ